MYGEPELFKPQAPAAWFKRKDRIALVAISDFTPASAVLSVRALGRDQVERDKPTVIVPLDGLSVIRKLWV